MVGIFFPPPTRYTAKDHSVHKGLSVNLGNVEAAGKELNFSPAENLFSFYLKKEKLPSACVALVKWPPGTENQKRAPVCKTLWGLSAVMGGDEPAQRAHAPFCGGRDSPPPRSFSFLVFEGGGAASFVYVWLFEQALNRSQPCQRALSAALTSRRDGDG